MVNTANAQIFKDPLTSPNPADWTISQTAPALYTYSYSSAGLSVQKDPTQNNPGGLNNISFDLNLPAIGAGNTNFIATVDMASAIIGNNNWDQIQLNTSFADGNIFDLVYDNSVYNPGVHVWDGAIQGAIPTSADAATLEIMRFNSTLTATFSGRIIFTENDSSNLTDVNFVLQNNNGSNDNNSVTFSNFSFTPANSVPEPSSFAACGLGLGLLFWRRKRNRS